MKKIDVDSILKQKFLDIEREFIMQLMYNSTYLFMYLNENLNQPCGTELNTIRDILIRKIYYTK